MEMRQLLMLATKDPSKLKLMENYLEVEQVFLISLIG